MATQTDCCPNTSAGGIADDAEDKKMHSMVESCEVTQRLTYVYIHICIYIYTDKYTYICNELLNIDVVYVNSISPKDRHEATETSHGHGHSQQS